jgi:hypothetical protein
VLFNFSFLKEPSIIVLTFKKKLVGSLGVGLNPIFQNFKPIVSILTFFQIQEPSSLVLK